MAVNRKDRKKSVLYELILSQDRTFCDFMNSGKKIGKLMSTE